MSGWILTAIGDNAVNMVFDPEEVRRAIAIFADPDHGIEFMALKSGVHRVISGKDVEAGAAAVESLPSGAGIYFRVNPVPEPVLEKSQPPAQNKTIVRRRWLYIDIDPVRDKPFKDDPATDAEKQATRILCDLVNNYLVGHGWPAPLVVDSGNGYGLYYRCDLPNDIRSRDGFRALLKKLWADNKGQPGIIDRSVHNANRLGKLPGTWARKGTEYPDRPYRPCRLLYVPQEDRTVSIELLEAAAGIDSNQPPPSPPVYDPARNGFAAANYPNGHPYGRAALDNECANVVIAIPGPEQGRNNQLNKSAFNLGQLVAAGMLNRDEVEQRLYEAACQSGLDTDDGGIPAIWKTIYSGIEAGIKKPRDIPTRGPDPQVVFGSVGQQQTGSTAAPSPQQTDQEFWSVIIDGEVVAEGPPADFVQDTTVGKSIGSGRTFELYTLNGLMEAHFPEPVWVIPGILSEGLNILAGKPKMGKSMLALNLAITVVAGGMALGDIQTTSGDILYLSLEDRTRRLQARARMMLKGAGARISKRLTVASWWPRQGQGGLEMIEWWMKRVDRPTLVIIDVWGKFRPPSNPKSSAYTQDYEHMTPLKDLMDSYGCCALSLMHCRKGKSEDIVEDVSGTLGIAGAADGIIVLERSRNNNEAKIFVTGRDVADTELALQFDQNTLTWKNLGPAEEHFKSKLQKSIIDFLKSRNGNAAFTSDIASALNQDQDKVRVYLNRLLEKCLVRKVGYAWAYPGESVPADENSVS
jgi:AAA domain